jgi:metal-dependent hydrolase (beta-lactamase superfamily II)
VVNVVKQAQAASGVAKVHAVLGGFHLALRCHVLVSRAFLP